MSLATKTDQFYGHVQPSDGAWSHFPNFLTDVDPFTTTFNSQWVRNYILRVSRPTLTHLRSLSNLRWCVITCSEFLNRRWPIYDNFQLSDGAWSHNPIFSANADPFTTTFNSQDVRNHIFRILLYRRWPIYDHFQLSDGVWSHISNFSTDADLFTTTINSQDVRNHIFRISRPTLTHLRPLANLRGCVITYSEFLDHCWPLYDHFQLSGCA